MKIAEKTESRLVVEVSDLVFARALLILFIVFLGAGATMYLYDSRAPGSERLWGTLLAAVLFLVAFLAVYERATFVFDRTTRELVWERRRALIHRSGKIRFDQIRDVVMQRTGTRVNPKKRVTLLVSPGGEIPISVAYAPDPGGSFSALQEAIKQFVR